jgi:hypothetical protein
MFTRVLLCVCFATGTMLAQEAHGAVSLHPFIGGSIGFSGGLGYLNPSWEVQAGSETALGRLFSVGSIAVARAQKIETGDGLSFHITTDTYLRMRKLLLGGGIGWGREQTSEWSKSSIHPRISYGYELSFARVTGAYILSGNDERNGVRGVESRIDFFLGQHWRIGEEVTVLSYFPTDQLSAPREHGARLVFATSYIR